MTEARVTLAIAAAGDVIALDLWDDSEPPNLPTGRTLPVEPRRWWLIDAAQHAPAITAHIADRGALSPLGGGLIRATLTGPGKVWLQSLPFSRLAGRMMSAAYQKGGSKGEGSVLGGLGGIISGDRGF